MHEISLIQNLLETVSQQIKAHNHPRSAIKGLALTVGALELHSEEAFRQAFAVESKGTALEQKTLELVIVPGQVQCSSCGYNGPLPSEQTDPHNLDLVVECPDCGAPTVVTGGRGIGRIELIMD